MEYINIYIYIYIVIHRQTIFYCITMKSPTNGWFCWPGRSSSGVDPVVSSHTWPCGHFTGCTRNQNKKPNNKQRVEGRNRKTWISNCKTQEEKSGTFKHSSMFLLWLMRELCKSSMQLPKMLTHLAIFFIVLCLDSMLQMDWLLQGLTPNWLTLFILLFRSLKGAQLFVWSSCQSRQRKVFWTLWHDFKDARDKIPSLTTHLRKHTEIHTYIFIYIYIYIYIYMNAHYCATS